MDQKLHPKISYHYCLIKASFIRINKEDINDNKN